MFEYGYGNYGSDGLGLGVEKSTSGTSKVQDY